MTQIPALPVGSAAPNDWWRRVSTTINLLLGELADVFRHPTQTITSDYGIGDGDYAVFADATANSVNITLPPVTQGRELIVKRLDGSANNVTMTGPIDGGTSLTITSQWQSYTVLGGTDRWYVI